MSSSTSQNKSENEQTFNILPVDESKKNPPPPQHTTKDGHVHGDGLTGGPDLKSAFHVGPVMMPGAFVGSMGTNSTALERENMQPHAKRD